MAILMPASKIRLYNTLSRKIEPIAPIKADIVGLYTCGPTVYDYVHIGNLRTYIFNDILERALEYNGYAVKRVMNITDVGHLTSDADTGEDKLDREARAKKKSVSEIAQFYTKAFLDDLKKLNIKIPKIIAPATAHIKEQIDMIKILFEKGFAYETANAVYFDVSKFPNYGKLSGQSLKEKTVGARDEVVVDSKKRNAADFALWFKLVGKFKNHLLRWQSPWGEGFPGWHIECSTISRHFLGQPFDIHTGGVDHIGTHHTNEIAQSEAAYGVPLANIWLHGEHLIINNARMGKSEGNFITLSDLEKKGYTPLAFRYLVLGAHYRTQLNFTWESLDAAANGANNISYALQELSRDLTSDENKNAREKCESQFLGAINNDLNTSQALAVFQEALDSSELSPRDKMLLAKHFDNALGLGLDTPLGYSPEKDPEIAEKARKYAELRNDKQFIQSDALRKEMEGLGYSVRDTTEGPRILKKFF